MSTSISWRERPFDGALRQVMLADAGRPPTIAAILDRLPDLPRGFLDLGNVRINGECVPRSHWALVRPRTGAPREVAITLHMPIGKSSGGSSGGSGSGKNTVALVATIAVLLVAAAVSGGALGALGVPLIGAGWGASVAGGVIGIGGALTIAALFPPPTLSPNQTQPTATGSAASAATSTPAALTGNALAPNAAVPRVIGTMRVFPPLLCTPLVELIGDVEYAEAVFGMAGPHALSAIWADGVDVATIPELDIEIQDGTLSAPRQSLVARQGYTAVPNVTLSPHLTDAVDTTLLANQANPDLAIPQWSGFVSRDSPDEVWINLAWPQGLLYTTTPGTTVNEAIRVRLRKRGDVSWINCPEVHFSRISASAFQKVIRIKWGAIPIATAKIPPSDGPVWAYKHVPGQNGTTILPATAGWDADSSFSAGSGNDLLAASTVATSKVLNTELYQDKVIFYLDPNVFPQGTYEIQLIRSCDYFPANFTPSAYTYSHTYTIPPDHTGGGGTVVVNDVLDFFQYQAAGGVNQIPVDDSGIYDVTVVSRIASVWNENPIQTGDFSTISVRVHNRTLGQLSVLASGYVYDWGGSAWDTFTTTSNPAPHFRDILMGGLGGVALPPELIDSAGLVAWRTACNSLSYTANAVLEGKTYMDALNVVASSGYARLRNSETWGVILDRDRSADTPVQIFTPRNMKNFAWTRPLAKLPTGLRATFTDIDSNYTANQIIVFDDPAHQDATLLSQIQYDGLVNLADVEARAAFDLLQADLRFTFYAGVADLEALVCQRGDLVGVQHDVLAAKAGFARIKSIASSAGNITGLVFEGTVPVDTETGLFSSVHVFAEGAIFNLGSKTGVAIRLKGGNGVLIKEITGATNDELTTVTFVTPFADPGTSQLDVDCLCAVGPLGSEYRRLLVYSVMPQSDMTATVTFVDEAPELWS